MDVDAARRASSNGAAEENVLIYWPDATGGKVQHAGSCCKARGAAPKWADPDRLTVSGKVGKSVERKPGAPPP